MSGDASVASVEAFWRAERRGATLVARLKRPTVRNAMNFACWRQLDGVIDEVEDDAAIRALVLTGDAGVFSAGGDMKTPEPRGAGLMRDAARLKFLQTVLARLARLGKPSLAAVEGPAVGVAWGLALTCDFVVAARDAKFMAPFASRALLPDGGVGFHLVRALGRLGATEILLGGRSLSGTEAFAAGLVSELTAPGEALERALARATTLAQLSPDTVALTLKALRRAEQSGYRDYLDAELELAALNLHNPDVAAGRMSFKAGGGTLSGKDGIS
jgi:2-(1,2-epoxy-1,2-dihydrophenyl)acetyl-CoA isomerase